jgi:hypothetical protein
MESMWLVIGILILAVVYTAHWAVRNCREKPVESAFRSHAPCALSIEVARGPIKKRQLEGISITECKRLIHASDNIMFLAIRQGSEMKFLHFPGIRAMSVDPSDLVDALRSVPDCCVVLCGQVELCSSILESDTDFAGSTPIFVLERMISRPAV